MAIKLVRLDSSNYDEYKDRMYKLFRQQKHEFDYKDLEGYFKEGMDKIKEGKYNALVAVTDKGEVASFITFGQDDSLWGDKRIGMWHKKSMSLKISQWFPPKIKGECGYLHIMITNPKHRKGQLATRLLKKAVRDLGMSGLRVVFGFRPGKFEGRRKIPASTGFKSVWFGYDPKRKKLEISGGRTSIIKYEFSPKELLKLRLARFRRRK